MHKRPIQQVVTNSKDLEGLVRGGNSCLRVGLSCKYYVIWVNSNL